MRTKLQYYMFLTISGVMYSFFLGVIANKILNVLHVSLKQDEDIQLFVFLVSMLLASTPFALIVLGIKISEKIVKRNKIVLSL